MERDKETQTRGLAAAADEIEARAYADLFAAAPAPLRAQLGLRVEQVAGASLLIAPGLPTPMFNRAIGLGLRSDADAGQVDTVVQAYRGAGCANWWLHWNPHGGPAGFAGQLAGMGFTQPARPTWAKVMRGTEPPPRIPTDLRVSPCSVGQVEQTAHEIAGAFGMPPFMAAWLAALHARPGWRIYTVADGERVVGGGCLYSAGELAWLGMGAVRESHRRRGGQGALMALRIRDAVLAGAQHIVTETGEAIADEPNPSLTNMKRCGFATVASRLNFAGPR